MKGADHNVETEDLEVDHGLAEVQFIGVEITDRETNPEVVPEVEDVHQEVQ